MEKGERKKNFKKGIDSDDARRRREETTIRIRCVGLYLTAAPRAAARGGGQPAAR